MESSDPIASQKAAVERASAGLLKTFAATPDDKLGYSPSETSRSSLWIMGHCAVANEAFAHGMRGGTFPPMPIEEFGRMVWEAGKDTASREEAVRAVETTTAALLAALDGLTPELLASSVDSPFGPIPMGLWMTFAADHMAGHLHQLEYLQTVWGDHHNHAM